MNWFVGLRLEPQSPDWEDVLSTRTVEPEVVKELRANPTVSVWPTAGRALGVGRHAAYQACRDGQVRYVAIGKKKWRVVSADLLRLLGLD
jgi:hypothetical protein